MNKQQLNQSAREVITLSSTTLPKEEVKLVGDKTIDLDKVTSVAILGNINSGKTNLAFYYMNSYQGIRNKYLFGYPITIEGYTNISDWGDLLKIRNGIIFIDELQRTIKTYEKKSNTQLMELLSMMAHKNNTLIFTTQLSQFVTRGVEAFIDCWALCRIQLDTLKNGSRPKQIIQRLSDIRKNDWVLDLEQGEFYEYSDKNGIGENRIKRFAFQNVGKDWDSERNCEENIKIIANKTEKGGEEI